MFPLILSILGLSGAAAVVLGFVAFILWARKNAPTLFMASMFLVLGAVTYWGGHVFASLETGSMTTLPPEVDVSGLESIDLVQAELSNMRNDVIRFAPWICAAAAALLTGFHFWPHKSAGEVDKAA
jgi:hypothetical protein